LKFSHFNIILFVMIFSGCVAIPQNEKILSFWTDIDLVEGEENLLLINDTPLATFVRALNNPQCGDSILMNFPINASEDLNLTLLDQQGYKHYLGYVNLYSISTGIKVYPETDSSIFVQHALYEDCTRIRLRW